MKHLLKNMLFFLFILILSPLFSQQIFWADKEVLSDGINFFSTFKSSNNVIYSAWQDVNYFPDNSGGLSKLIIQKSLDGYSWETIQHTIPAVTFYGITPIKNYSIDSNSDGDLVLAHVSGKRGAYTEASIYSMKKDSNKLKLLSTIEYDRAVLQPSIYFRGDNGNLGYIFFASQLKTINSETLEDGSEITLESGALSIFEIDSLDGITWSSNKEFISTDSDQSYLPIYKFYNNQEIVIYQSLYTSDNQNNNFQLYLKQKESDSDTWSQDALLTKAEEFVTGVGNESFEAFDNQRASFTLKGDELGLTWERSYGYDASKIYFSPLEIINSEYHIGNPEKVTTGSRSCSRPRGFEFNNKFYLLWFDNQLGSNDIVMAEPDKKSGLWIEKIVSNDRNYFSVFGDFVLFKNSLRIYWEDQLIDRDNYNQSRGRILALNPDRSVNSPIIRSNYKERNKDTIVSFSWTIPRDSSGIKSFFYTWGKEGDDTLVENRVLSTVTKSQLLRTLDDGNYIFTIKAEDNAGNISNIRSYTYLFDKTAPDMVTFPEIRTDERGYLLSNTESIVWDSWDSDVAGFSHSLVSLGSTYNVDNFDITKLKKSNNYSLTQSISFKNIDNGFYALIVRAIDIAGNIGNPQARIFKVDKYVPITYISYINYSQNSNGELVTTIYGRGFKADGDVTTVILDKDGLEPYDYQFSSAPNIFNVVTDRRIEGPNLDEIEGGTYRVGIIHPVRGLVFSNPIVKVESTGTIKFGDFTQGYNEVWQTVKPKKINLSIELVLFIAIILIAIIILIFSVIRLVSIVHDGKRLVHDANALVLGTPFLTEKKIIRIRDMKKHGFGLRMKFTVLIISLIVVLIALISLPLASFMIDTQKKNLTDSLVSRTEILLNSISTSAKDYLELKKVLELNNLIKTTDAMDEVLWGTIVGVSNVDPKGTNALWAYTDEKIAGYYTPLPQSILESDFTSTIKNNITEEDLEKFNTAYSLKEDIYQLNNGISTEIDLAVRKIITDSGYPREFRLGETEYKDIIDAQAIALEDSIETKASLDLGDKKIELERLTTERSRATDSIIKQELQESINILNKQIDNALKEMSSNTGKVPDIHYQNVEEHDSYLFFKPIIYQERGVDTYYKGMVRLEVSTETIKREISNSRRSLIIRVGITAIVAILIGFLGALVLATLMINPIKKLVAGVQVIRDTEDKSQLKNHLIEVKSRDELFTLASTVNQMTEGLVKAAAMSKDVTMGKEIQKMFIPLELNPNGEGKLTTGEFENDEISVFGYYEGAKGVSGDYFDYRQIDDDHFAMIKCDIAGKGVPASLIMVEVATIFLSYFRGWDRKREGYRIDKLVYSMNDLLEERGFKGRFAAFIVVIMNTKTGKCHMCNAGDNLVHIYRSGRHEMETITLHEVPAAGIFSSDMLEMQGGYKVETTVLDRNDILFLRYSRFK
ncbi:MAG: hypothetical protein B6229_02005 [Spirochaetaceae bacterium 4572_7]|nr:MAG: hypothetical protein B6229_02005 [Spirochaetaceae bacterium 4572_7]